MNSCFLVSLWTTSLNQLPRLHRFYGLPLTLSGTLSATSAPTTSMRKATGMGSRSGLCDEFNGRTFAQRAELEAARPQPPQNSGLRGLLGGGQQRQGEPNSFGSQELANSWTGTS